jgi:hypothetical protein
VNTQADEGTEPPEDAAASDLARAEKCSEARRGETVLPARAVPGIRAGAELRPHLALCVTAVPEASGAQAEGGRRRYRELCGPILLGIIPPVHRLYGCGSIRRLSQSASEWRSPDNDLLPNSLGAAPTAMSRCFGNIVLVLQAAVPVQGRDDGVGAS